MKKRNPTKRNVFARRAGSNSKFGSTWVKSNDGRSFHSKLERAVYEILKLREKAQEIEIVQCQAQVELTNAKIIYKPDFKVKRLRDNYEFFVEAKGFETPEWRIKRKLWIHYGPAELEVWGGSHTKPTLKEILKP